MENASKPRGIAERVVAVCAWVALWFCAAAFVNNDILLAGPVQTVSAMATSFATAGFWSAVWHSFCTIAGFAALSGILGAALGLIASKVRWFSVLLAPAMQVMKSAPVACVVVILLVVLGSKGAIAVIVAFVALPPFYVAGEEAARYAGSDESRVLSLMGVRPLDVFLASTWPHILPYFQSAAKTSMALSWRAGIMGELLAIPLGSIGAEIYMSKLTLDTPGLLAWTVVVMLLAWGCEKAAVGLLGLTAKTPSIAAGRRRHAIGKGAPCKEDAMGAEGDALLEVRGATKSYDGTEVLGCIDMGLYRGSRICLMSPTGGGKSTLIRIMLGMEEPDGGSVTALRPLAVMMQGTTLVLGLSALDNVVLCASSVHSASEIRAALEALLPEGTIEKKASELSGGTRRLAELARAAFSGGKAFVLDEPFAGLDDDSRKRACAFLLEHLDGRPLLVATHNLEDATLLSAEVFRI